MLSDEAIKIILGLDNNVKTTPEDLSKEISLTFYPSDKDKVSRNVSNFAKKLEQELKSIGVNIIPYSESLETVPYSKRIRRLLKSLSNNFLYILEKIYRKNTKRFYLSLGVIVGILKKKRLRPGVSVISLGEQDLDNMPINVASSFRLSSVITIVDKPEQIDEKADFKKHFDTAMSLFAYHMSNIIILVDNTDWIVYNFNASHPIYKINSDFRKNILYGLIPKIAAPIRPYRLRDFIILGQHFDPTDEEHIEYTMELSKSGSLFTSAGIYPPGKKISDLPFRNKFHEWIGELHLDHRTGMSYGFLAWQLPSILPELELASKNKLAEETIELGKDYFYDNKNNLNIIIKINNENYFIKLPEVWVLSQRSGSDKTKVNPQEDLVKIGLKNGKMYLQTGAKSKINSDYKPSFDTGVILAHAAGNVIVGSILKHFGNSDFADRLSKNGVSISHWHGYINPKLVPKGWQVHGHNNPHVACSSPQSSIFALRGKLESLKKVLDNGGQYLGDVHIEPHHGTNIIFSSLIKLGELMTEEPSFTTLGNKYLNNVD